MKTLVSNLKYGMKFKFTTTSSWLYVVDSVDLPEGGRSKSGVRLNGFIVRTTDGDEFHLNENESVWVF